MIQSFALLKMNLFPVSPTVSRVSVQRLFAVSEDQQSANAVPARRDIEMWTFCCPAAVKTRECPLRCLLITIQRTFITIDMGNTTRSTA
jgi:hypothetical protein